MFQYTYNKMCQSTNRIYLKYFSYTLIIAWYTLEYQKYKIRISGTLCHLLSLFPGLSCAVSVECVI